MTYFDGLTPAAAEEVTSVSYSNSDSESFSYSNSYSNSDS